MTKKPDETDLDALMGAGEEPLDPSGLLTNEEVLEARANAKAKVLAERKLAAMRAIEERETQRLKVEDGLTTGIDEMDEVVNITIDLAPYADKISVNGPLGSHYYHGHTYSVPRHVANSLTELMYRSWRTEDQVDGKSTAQMLQRRHNTAINAKSGAVLNAPRPFHA